MLLGSGFLSLKDPVYESKLFYSVDAIPPFYDANKALADFHDKFYSISVFEEWKQNNISTSLVFEDFSATKVVDGFLFSKDKSEQLARLSFEKKGGSFLIVKSNQPRTLDDFFEYASHINRLLKGEYVVRAKKELKIIDVFLKELRLADRNITGILLSVNRYIVNAETGANVFSFQRPTMPRQVSPASFRILAMSVVLGGMVGVFFILIRNAIAKRKEPLAQA